MEIWKKMWVGVFFWTQCTNENMQATILSIQFKTFKLTSSQITSSHIIRPTVDVSEDKIVSLKISFKKTFDSKFRQS